MTFAGRYKLGDLLLTTSVETFPAIDLRDQGRVLVHVFLSREHRLGPADPPQRVIDRFVELTGASPALVRAAAVDPPTGYAYVVTEELAQETISAWGRSLADGNVSSCAPAAGLSGLFAAMPETKPAAAPTSAAPISETAAMATRRLPVLRVPESGQAAPDAFTKESAAVNGEVKPQEPVQAAGIRREHESPGATSGGGPGMFTKMFGIPAAPVSSKDAATPPAARGPSATSAGSSGAGPGAFTKMFGVPAALSEDGATATPPHATPSNDPGAFTKMFRVPAALSKETTASAPSTPSSGPGAFTKMFGVPAAPSSRDAQLPGGDAGVHTRPTPSVVPPRESSSAFPEHPLPPAPPEPKSPIVDDQGRSTQPGAFTRMFGSPVATPPVSSGSGGSFTRIFGSERAAEPARLASNEGDFTKIFGHGPADKRPGTRSEPAAGPVEPLPFSLSSPPEPARVPPAGPPLSSTGPLERTTPGSSTRFFNAAAPAAPEPAPGVPAGPSEYTRVISLRAITPPGTQPPPAPPATPSTAPPAMPAGAPPFPGAPAAFPSTSGMSVPPAAFPSTPGMPVPQASFPNAPAMPMPQAAFPAGGMPMPQAPPMTPVPWSQSGGAAPTPGAAPQAGSRRWLPLILIFNALFVLAVLVIMLFALKGR